MSVTHVSLRTSYLTTILTNSLYPALLERIYHLLPSIDQNVPLNEKALKQLSLIIGPQPIPVFRISNPFSTGPFSLNDERKEVYNLLMDFHEKTKNILIDPETL